MKRIDAISRWIRDQVEEAGAKGVVLGLSGGIDSAVVAALAQRSLGDNVLGLILPCHSHKEDAEHAAHLASHLQMEAITVDLTAFYDNLISILPPADKHITANLKPRLRMTVLYYFAGLRNYLVAGTGNKCEIAVGYFTKYGDGGVDLLPLGDLLKSQIREIAYKLALPEAIITKPPSAGLLPGQTDEGELKLTYDELEQALLELTAESGETTPREVRARVEELIEKAGHKKNPIPVYKNS
jgi:NAD+ synthase